MHRRFLIFLAPFLLSACDDSARFSKLVQHLGAAEEVALFEGLPHQMFERTVFERERKMKPTREIAGYHFYEQALPASSEDLLELKAMLMDRQLYRPFSGEKLCGGFHPDYALSWQTKGGIHQALVCFGCHEIKASGPRYSIRADTDDMRFEKLSSALKKYRVERPPEESNQAMQRPAIKPAIYASWVGRRASMLWFMHSGLAAAVDVFACTAPSPLPCAAVPSTRRLPSRRVLCLIR